jgi:NAD(P)-dependent dehydrogenase (short-subunit alcohol dehydrogenase family)
MKTVSLAGKVIVVTGGTQGIGATVSLDAAVPERPVFVSPVAMQRTAT